MIKNKRGNAMVRKVFYAFVSTLNVMKPKLCQVCVINVHSNFKQVVGVLQIDGFPIALVFFLGNTDSSFRCHDPFYAIVVFDKTT